ncbi:ATP-dependent helicase HrpB [Cohnella endophytica]|uniref:ATP-dependent helicase HrpB n=1 Tax=Cohnella endophytica TaxID=2419778 RepID=A0A494XBJ1_9BACL|nr:ATP-dependent helicase HrpB [Cohnella endophytica]RKP45856.1 ATP-dependent helicase HrpB [Cohnella endophytica]
MTNLPIDEVLDDLRNAMREGRNAVLVAAPGAGKTTRVPLALLDEPWLAGRKIVMLEPRRLAARSSAAYMARSLGETVGGKVGYRVKLDTKIGPRTRIEVVTEGVLTRMLQSDAALDGVGLVIFDEFHERSLQADLGLALSLQSQDLLRDDLKLLVMSATIEAEPVAGLLGGAPIIRSEGRSFPVETVYRPKPSGVYLDDAVAQAVADALRSHDGDVLVFLPGVGEIRSTEGKLRSRLGSAADSSVRIHPLYGSMTAEAQDSALAPLPTGMRKVVLATSVAETSLTVEGVTVVIDSGLMRVSRFSPRTGMSRLETVTVSAASADQRRGRAGRLMPGTCYRLWSAEEQSALAPRSAPEIAEADLSALLLELAVWGAQDVSELQWLDAPPAPALQQARELLVQLGALSRDGTAVTAHGKRMALLGKHPRIAHMLLRAQEIGLGDLACELAALLGERDVIRASAGQAPNADLRIRLEALRGRGAYAHSVESSVRGRLIEEARRTRRELEALTVSGASETAESLDDCGLLLAFAYPDRIGRQRDNGKFLLSGGRGAAFAPGQPLAHESWIVVADVDDAGTDSRIRLAATVSYELLAEHLQEAFAVENHLFWDSESKSVRGRARKKLGAILIEETPLHKPRADSVQQVLFEGIRAEGLGMLPWTKAARQLQERTVFTRHHDVSWPDLSDEALLGTLEHWLDGYVGGMKGRGDLQKLNLKDLLESMLSWDQRRELDKDAPTHWTVPSGSRIPIDYSDIDAPAVSVRLQELFGLPETPRIAGGRVPLTLHLLSPAQRPMQVTRDLASFWSNGYFEVRKDLKGRYPKHYWPDNPLEAEATRRAKPPGK